MNRRSLAVIASAVLGAALLGPGLAAVNPSVSAVRAATPPRVVVVVGPVGSMTDSYLEWGTTIAQDAAAHGANVVEVFHPNATWAAVAAAAAGANVLIYLGHGNGFPSPYTSTLMPDRQDGMGLDSVPNATTTQLAYFGEQYMATLHLAPGALVILNHLCYASGNSEPGLPDPTPDVAVQRVDNFAAGFLAGGASAVLAVGLQGANDFFPGLFGPPETLDQLFMSTGANGTAPITVPSVRTPGAQLHLDPSTATSGFYRSIAGNLQALTSSVVGADASSLQPGSLVPAPVPSPAPSSSPVPQPVPVVPPVQADPPVLSSVFAPSVFTPNGDGVGDTLPIAYVLNVPSTLDVSIVSAAGQQVRHMSVPVTAGAGRVTWDGRDDAGAIVPDGAYSISIVPAATSGLVGAPVEVATRILTAIKGARAMPAVFWPLDRDGIADRTVLAMTTTQPATVTWTMEDMTGHTVRTFWRNQAVGAGTWTMPWNGIGAGATPGTYRMLPAGEYLSVISAVTPAGRILTRTAVWMQPFRLVSTAAANPGQIIAVTIIAAERLRATPRLMVAQPGLAPFAVTATPVSGTGLAFRAVFRLRAGPPGAVRLIVTGTELRGASVSGTSSLILR